MVESDRSEEDRMDSSGSPLRTSKEPTAPTGKRSREEVSENEEDDLPTKQPRLATDKDTEINGTAEKKGNKTANNSANDKGKESDAGSNDDKKESSKKEDEDEDEDEDDTSQKNGSTNEEIGVLEKETAERQSASDNEQSTSNSLVVDGLELKVECASDKEASSSESESEKDKKPRPKTQIVKAEPNESELDVSSDEKRSDVEDGSDADVKQDIEKKGSQKAIDDIESSDSIENNSDDEDYSPRTKRKLKKSPVSKKTAKSSPGKRGRGRKRGRPRLSESKKSQEDEEEGLEDEVDEVSKEEEKEKDEEKEEEKEKKETKSSGSDKESSSDHSENESDNEVISTKDVKQKKREAVKPDDDKRIKSLKKYIRTAGITVKSYNDLWSGCKSNAARVKRLKELLEEHGIKGRPTLEKCKKAKARNERLNEAAALDTKNIISEGRVTRARRNMDIKSNTSPQTRESRNAFRRIQCVDSDSE